MAYSRGAVLSIPACVGCSADLAFSTRVTVSIPVSRHLYPCHGIYTRVTVSIGVEPDARYARGVEGVVRAWSRGHQKTVQSSAEQCRIVQNSAEQCSVGRGAQQAASLTPEQSGAMRTSINGASAVTSPSIVS